MNIRKFSTVLSVFVLLAATCFGQQNEVVFLEPQKTQQPQGNHQPMSARMERTSINAGVLMGGGGIVGADLEFLLGKRIAMQMGAGMFSLGCGMNYHFKPQINSSFVSLQYCHLGFGENHIGSTLGPMFIFRTKRLFQAGIGYGIVTNKGAQWEQAYKEDVSVLVHFNIGLYFPL